MCEAIVVLSKDLSVGSVGLHIYKKCDWSRIEVFEQESLANAGEARDSLGI